MKETEVLNREPQTKPVITKILCEKTTADTCACTLQKEISRSFIFGLIEATKWPFKETPFSICIHFIFHRYLNTLLPRLQTTKGFRPHDINNAHVVKHQIFHTTFTPMRAFFYSVAMSDLGDF